MSIPIKNLLMSRAAKLPIFLLALSTASGPPAFAVSPAEAHPEATIEKAVAPEWELLRSKAVSLYSQSNFSDALKAAEQALEIALTNFEANDGRLGASYNNVAANQYALGDYQKAFDTYSNAIENYLIVYGPTSYKIAIILSNQGEAARFLDIPDTAERKTREAINILEATNDPAHRPLLYAALANLANLRFDAMDFPEAELLQNKALKLSEDLYGAESSETANAYTSLAKVKLAQGNASKAKEILETSIPILERDLGRDHVDVAYAKEVKADVLLQLKEYSAALSVINESVENHKSRFGSDSSNIADALARRADILVGMGDFASAERDAVEAEKLLTEQLGAKHSRVYLAKFERSFIYLNQKRYAEAENLALEVFNYYERKGGNPLMTFNTLGVLFDIYHQTERADKRDALISRADELRSKLNLPNLQKE
jgi:tetratricopeptide (TPR) repeat protein